MSELFDLLNIGTPGSARQRHRRASPSPSPCARVAWRDAQPSPSPDGAHLDDECPEAPAHLATAKENIPFGFGTVLAPPSPTRLSAVRARRRARRSQSNKYVYARPSDERHASNLKPRTSPRTLSRVQSDPTASSPLSTARECDKSGCADALPTDATAHAGCADTTRFSNDNALPTGSAMCPSSDDSFSRILDESPMDAAAVDEIASRQGW